MKFLISFIFLFFPLQIFAVNHTSYSPTLMFYKNDELIKVCDSEKKERKNIKQIFIQHCVTNSTQGCRIDAPSTPVGGKPNPEFDACMKDVDIFCKNQADGNFGENLNYNCKDEINKMKPRISKVFSLTEIKTCGLNDQKSGGSALSCIKKIANLNNPRKAKASCGKFQKIDCWQLIDKYSYNKKLHNFCLSHLQINNFFLPCLNAIKEKEYSPQIDSCAAPNEPLDRLACVRKIFGISDDEELEINPDMGFDAEIEESSDPAATAK